MSVGLVSFAFQYDTAGRRTGGTDAVVADGKSFFTGYAYDTHDRLTAIEYATLNGASSRRRVGFDYDAEGRITRIFEGAQNYAHTMSYHPSGALLAFTSGNGVANTFAYDVKRYWPTSITAGTWTLSYENYDRSETSARSRIRVLAITRR